ncbi:LON peptidase substrate-binding domain-containing protein [Leptospira sp. 96542]|nr:LON peptidase substrate-binding domain-containing protein [Leptospira sp. 96542]
MSTFTLPLFPLPEVFLFPGTFLPLHIFEPRYRSMLDFCLENGGEMGMAAYPKNHPGRGSSPPLPKIVGYGQIIQHEALPDGRSNIILEGLETAKILEILSDSPFIIAKAERRKHETNPKLDASVKADIENLLILTKRILLADGAEESLILKMNQILNHPYPVDFIASLIHFDFQTKQDILETTKIKDKIFKLHQILWNLNLRE